MSLRIARTALIVSLVASAACVVRLNERNAPLENGGVSGAAADCGAIQVLPGGAPGADVKTKFIGRFDMQNPDRPRFDWSGNIMSARFDGPQVTWGVDIVPPAKETRETIFEVTIDGVSQEVILGGGQPNTKTHDVGPGVHEISVVRSSEALFGVSVLVPFTFPGGTQLPPTERARRIEYIGDSITCGYGNEGPNATCPYNVTVREITEPDGTVAQVKIPKTQNIDLAYGSIAARKLDADAVTICFSGKGMVKNYREVTQEAANAGVDLKGQAFDPDAKTTIPEYYLRTIATVREDTPPMPPAVSNLWDFSKEPEPAVVVINVGQNDFARDFNQDTIADGLDIDQFREGYKAFVQFVRGKRPNAHIFLAVTPMLSDKFPLDNARRDFRAALSRIVSELNGAGDGKVYWFELVEMGSRYGLGCDYHPNLEVHRIMADQVAGAIRSKTCW
ncbi:MAG: hypothetical protein KF819_23815 [Labilithrix sp.]|nr:hypothetical protein [Labilithrix sp.]